MTEEALFELLVRTPEGERAALLERACEGQPALRKRVEALLQADAAAGSPLARSPIPQESIGMAVTAHSAPTDRPGVVIGGKYKLIEEIGEGGMGQVFMAQQMVPVKRAVAVKVIKAGMDSKAVLTRFEAERQALALMDHPNIAKVLDAGATESGRPYFVMELVKGQPITRFCDDRKLTPRQRLELFVPVCQAIQHAHQKGVIHRDIKPNNVLVALYDDKPVPKVIDFGVAKATGPTLTDKTLMTGFGAVVGTPEYMSPEQASINNLDIDTRSDVYSLGVLLYELLTGSTPVNRQSLGNAALLEILRIVREVDAPKPSAKLSTIDTLPSVAANRGTEPAKLSKLMKGELDWVLLKALDKDRTRRYDTANGLARDIERYLSNEVVEARPPSAGYRLRKMVSRNKGKVVAAGLILLALLLGMVGTTWGLWEAEKQRQQAIAEALAKDQARQEEVTQRQRAEVAMKQSLKRLTQIEKANDILGSIFENLDPKEIVESQRPLQATLVEKLEQAIKQLDGESIGDPVMVATMQQKLGVSLRALGESTKAIPILEKACAVFESHLGSEHPSTLHCQNSLAQVYQSTGKPLLALPLYQKGLLHSKKQASSATDVLTYMNNVASAYEDAGMHQQAIPLYQETLQLASTQLGKNHPVTMSAMNNLAGTYRHTDQLQLSLPLYEETLALRKTTLGLDHPDTLRCMNNLAGTYWQAHQLDKSIPLFEQTLKRQLKVYGRAHPSTLLTIANLGVNLKDAGRTSEAIPFIEEAYHSRLKYPKFRGFCVPLFECYIQAGKALPAVALLPEVVADARNALPPGSPSLADALSTIAVSLLQVKACSAGEPLLRECLAIREKKPHEWITYHTQTMLGSALLGQKKYAEAEPLLLKGVKGLKVRYEMTPGTDTTRLVILTHTSEAFDRLIQLYTETQQPDEVKKWQAEKDKLPKPVEQK